MYKKILSILLCICFFINTVKADVVNNNPKISGFKLNENYQVLEKMCRKNGGNWFSNTNLNLYSCKSKKYNVNFEANSDDIVYSIFIIYKTENQYREELKKFSTEHRKIMVNKKGANLTEITEFVDKKWVANFLSYGHNGNYRVHVFDTANLIKNTGVLTPRSNKYDCRNQRYF